MKSIALIVLIIFTIPIYASEKSFEYKDWSLTSHDGFVRYLTHGNTVYGHQFGFIKKVSNCNQDIFWISWTATGVDMVDKFNKYKGTDIQLDFKIGETQFQLEVPFLTSHKVSKTLTMTAFSNFSVNENLINSLEKGVQIDLRLVSPNDLVKLYDMPYDYFSLRGFTAVRLKAREYCKALNNPTEKVVPQVARIRAKSIAHDAEFQDDVKILCSKVGEICAMYKQKCSKSEYSNICMYHSLYRSIALIIHCEGENFQTCMSEYVEYEGKLTAFMDSQDIAGSSPRSMMARTALNKCEPFNIIPVSSSLIDMTNKLKSVDPALTRIFDFKPYFECTKEQWMK